MSAWEQIVQHDGSDEWLALCEQALEEFNQLQALHFRADLQDQIYLELVKFNATAAWSILQLAQMRQYLAEHLAQALTATTTTTEG